MSQQMPMPTQVLTQLITFVRLMLQFRLITEVKKEEAIPPTLELSPDQSALANFIVQYQLSEVDLMALTLTLIPHTDPGLLNSELGAIFPKGGDFPDFGGAKGKNHQGILPTGEGLLFIIAGNDLESRLIMTDYLLSQSVLFRMAILDLESVPEGEPIMSGRLIMDEEYLALFTTGAVLKPRMSANFPADIIQTNLEWSDLILQDKVMAEIQEIQTWLTYNHVLMEEWGLKGKVKPGYRVMFYGPPGTGKTLTASLLGKYTGRDVYRIDLSMVVSKYIGETEKNLSKLFDKAKNKDWILFFDEADSVFGKRTSVRDAHDKYANQEVSYLLQRIETHPGLVILASNLKNNMDIAFTRRFQTIIEYQSPGVEERILLWENNLPKELPLEDDVSLRDLSRTYELTGANIVNVVQYACLKTAEAGKNKMCAQFLVDGIKKEYIKEGKMM